MYEIELKAHVDDYEKTKSTINTFAQFLGTKEKNDVYWQIDSTQKQNSVRVRIRQETSVNANGEKSNEIKVTYKQKEMRRSSNIENSFDYEVNKEHEFSISDRSAFETILVDTGFELDIVKQKKVEQWKYKRTLIELCTIVNLGDFLELEIISENQNDEIIQESVTSLQNLLIQCDIPLDKIEKRYYSELLREKRVNVLE